MELGRSGTRTSVVDQRNSPEYGSSPAILAANHAAAGSADCRELKERYRFALEIHLRQPDPVQQHDLPLGLAKEAEDSFAMKI